LAVHLQRLNRHPRRHGGDRNTATVMGGGIYNSAGTVTRKPGRSVSGNTPDDCRLC
jgi:hypothetical protein